MLTAVQATLIRTQGSRLTSAKALSVPCQTLKSSNQTIFVSGNKFPEVKATRAAGATTDRDSARGRTEEEGGVWAEVPGAEGREPGVRDQRGQLEGLDAGHDQVGRDTRLESPP